MPFLERTTGLLPGQLHREDPAEHLATRFSADLTPCLPLMEEERAALVAVLPGSTSYTVPALSFRFYGRAEIDSLPPSDTVFLHLDPGRVVTVATIHALDLHRLHSLRSFKWGIA